jgi:hypothetical protein
MKKNKYDKLVYTKYSKGQSYLAKVTNIFKYPITIITKGGVNDE